MSVIELIVRRIDQFTLAIGKAVAWLTLLMVMITCLVVALRYIAGVGSIALQESVTYLHASVFLLGCAYTLQKDGHVRVDILYHRLSPRFKAVINLLGGLFFLLPLCCFIAWSSWDYVLAAWAVKESSPEAGGIPAVFLLKTLIPVMAASLFLQGVSETLRSFLVIIGKSTPEATGQ